MSSGTPIGEHPGYAAAADLVSLGSFPLLGCMFSGFVLGGLFGFWSSLAGILLLAAPQTWLRRSWRGHPRGSHRAAPWSEARSLAGDRLAVLSGLVNIVLYAVVLRALCGDTRFALLLAVAGLLWAARSLRNKLSACAAGVAWLTFHPLCLGLIASCAGASTWPQLFATPAQSRALWPGLSCLAWVGLATLASAWQQPGFGVMATSPRHWSIDFAACLLWRLPASFLGLLAGVSYYDVHGSRAGFAQTLSWVVGSSTFCARWFVALTLMAGLLALVRRLSGLLLSMASEEACRGVGSAVSEFRRSNRHGSWDRGETRQANHAWK